MQFLRVDFLIQESRTEDQSSGHLVTSVEHVKVKKRSCLGFVGGSASVLEKKKCCSVEIGDFQIGLQLGNFRAA